MDADRGAAEPAADLSSWPSASCASAACASGRAVTDRAVRGYATGLKLLRLSDLAERPITGLPAGARIEKPPLAPDGARVAFTHTGTDGIELWVAEVATGQARRLGTAQLNLSAGTSPQWLMDGSLITTLVPTGQGPEPPAPTVPSGPILQENRGKTAPARTYQDLLKSASDEALFEYYLTSQVARITLDGQSRRSASRP